MQCPKCNQELPIEARFCPTCGCDVTQRNAVGDVGPLASNGAVKSLMNATKGTDDSTLQMLEGILSVVLAVMIVFAPVLELDYYFGNISVSMISLVAQLTKFSDYLGKYAFVGPVLAIDMVFSCVGIAMNARQAFRGELTQLIEITKDVRIPNSSPGAATSYALFTIILLAIAASNTHNIVGASIWVWVLLLGGLTCQTTHFVRWMRKMQQA